MKRFRNLLNQSEFHALLFCAGMVLLNWPVLGILQPNRPESALSCIFGLWALFILLLRLVAGFVNNADSESTTNNERNQP